jgi:TPR repeat protein
MLKMRALIDTQVDTKDIKDLIDKAIAGDSRAMEELMLLPGAYLQECFKEFFSVRPFSTVYGENSLMLGFMYQYGVGTDKNIIEARKCYEEVTAYISTNVLKHPTEAPHGFYLLGELEYAEKNIDTAIEHFEQAAKLKDPIASYRLGMFAIEGFNVKKDLNTGIRYFEISADFRNPNAQDQLAQLLYRRDLRGAGGTAHKYFETVIEAYKIRPGSIYFENLIDMYFRRLLIIETPGGMKEFFQALKSLGYNSAPIQKQAQLLKEQINILLNNEIKENMVREVNFFNRESQHKKTLHEIMQTLKTLIAAETQKKQTLSTAPKRVLKMPTFTSPKKTLADNKT